MAKVTHHTSVYLKVPCCTECSYFQSPTRPTRNVCPLCGSELEDVVGRYTYTETKNFFSTRTTYDKFVRGK